MAGRDTEIQVDFNVKGVEQVERGDQALDKLGGTAEKSGKGVAGLGERMTAFGGKMDKVGKGLSDVGGAMAKTFGAGALAVGAGLGTAVNTAMNFEAAMSKVQAISKASGDDLDQLSNIAREMGATTQFSASQAAEGLTYMAMAGYDTEKMIGSLPGVLSLAAAGGADLATTSDIVTDAMSGLQMSADETGKFVNIMAATVTGSNTDITMMGETLKYTSTIAGSLGVSMEDLSIAIGLMGNNAVKSSQAGTAIRSGLTRLIKPPKEAADAMKKFGVEVMKNSDGTINLRDTMQGLRTALVDVDPATKNAAAAAIFGQEAFGAWLAIVDSSDESFDKLASSIDNSEGVASTMADVMNNNLAGAFKTLNSALEEAQISIGQQLIPAVRWGAEAINGLVNKFNALSPATKKFIAFGAAGLFVFLALGAVIGVFLMALGGIITSVGTVATALGGVITAFGGVGAAISAILGPIALVIGVVVALGGAFYLLWTRSETFRNGLISLWESLKAQLTTALNTAVAFFQGIGQQLVTWWQTNGTMIMAAAQNVITFLTVLFQSFLPVFQGIWTIATTVVQLAWSVITAVISGAIAVITGLVTFFAAVFTGNWSAAFDAVAGIVEAGRTLWTTVIDAALNAILTIVSTILESVYQTFQNIWGNITGFLEGIDLYSIGSDIMSGLLNGISDMGEKVLSKAKEIAIGIKDTVAGMLGVKSPSRVMMEIGMWTSAGMALGMEQGAPMVEKSSAQVADAAVFGPASGSVSNSTANSSSSTVNKPQITININGGGNAGEIASSVRGELEDWFASLGNVSPRSIEV
ncbi:tail tape measure protein [Exiguobacterium phage vB_EauM-23]|nr:tail tape measure protein [Exiguobacterium phage vB_EauM-23]